MKLFLFWCTFFVSLVASAQDTTIVRGPYLQQTSQTSTYICWKTDSLTITKISYGTSKQNLSSVFYDNTLIKNHFAHITGLLANTKYFYTINITNFINCPDTFYFYTTPANNTSQRMRFMALGDCGSGYPEQYNLKKAINYYNQSHLDGILLLGDNAYENGLETEYQNKFFDVLKTDFFFPYTCIYPAPGNHDYANNTALAQNHSIPYYDIFKTPQLGELGGLASNHKEFYSFNYGNIHFISLDSYGIESGSYHLWDTLGPQYQWLKQDLQQDHSLWKIVYFHHPPYTMGTHNSDTENDLIQIREHITPLLEKYGVDLVLNGHSHNYERSWLQKGHQGLENTFHKSTHTIDSSSAKYDATLNSCPYIKDSITNNGVVYIVAGEAGKHGWGQSSFPHNSKYYSEYNRTGALFFEVENNRLDAFYLEEDSLIHDHFTIFKNVNRNISINALLNQSVVISASWPGTYNWEFNQSTSKTQTITVLNTSQYIVRDSLNCLADTFNILITDVKDIKYQANDLQLFPNPAKDKLTVQFKNINSLEEIRILTNTGKSIYVTKLVFNEGKSEFNLANLNLAPGSYIFSLKISEKTLTRPFFIVR
jgi:acid phosphatase type 7